MCSGAAALEAGASLPQAEGAARGGAEGAEAVIRKAADALLWTVDSLAVETSANMEQCREMSRRALHAAQAWLMERREEAERARVSRADESRCQVMGMTFAARPVSATLSTERCAGCAAKGVGMLEVALCDALGPCLAHERKDMADVVWVLAADGKAVRP